MSLQVDRTYAYIINKTCDNLRFEGGGAGIILAANRVIRTWTKKLFLKAKILKINEENWPPIRGDDLKSFFGLSEQSSVSCFLRQPERLM